ncbi:cytidine deaminase family protein [Amycolatopsis suaedae]|uniref:Cytidine deaminase n=1 Tax=Amycolatopsis suaedae TaxID=2510978 RepID=A0A4Q7JDM1_9PSEU|nr:cytidine deaminase [Amycolatopsis suaedae]RZQ65991.1 cytidine deaminase [Amycolatopsis suaedae]
MDAAEIISRAAGYLNPTERGDRTSGGVATALLTKDGTLFYGVCIDTISGMGFCAEHAAAAAMLTAGQSEVAMVVAVTRDDDGLSVLPPCGRCREFLYQIDDRNLDAQVVLGPDTVATLADLLPERQARPVPST